MASMLQQNGYEVTVIAAMPNYPTGAIFDGYKNKRIVRENFEGIKVVRTWIWPTNSSSKIKRFFSLLSYTISIKIFAAPILESLAPEIILVSSPPFVTGYFGLEIAKKTAAKLVLNVSDLWPQSAHDLGFIKNGFLYQKLQKMELAMYNSANAFSVQSAAIEKHIYNLQPYKKIFLYRNLPSISEYATKKRPEGKRIIVYAGLLGVAQGVLEIIRKINFNALGTELHIYGQGFQLDEITKFIHQNPNKGVCYKGSVLASLLPQILSNYHAMLVPLSAEIEGAVPSKIFSAMANALPVFYCGGGEAAQIVTEYKVGFVASAADAKTLSANIQNWVKMDEQQFEKMRQACLVACNTTFNQAEQDNRFLGFLNSL